MTLSSGEIKGQDYLILDPHAPLIDVIASMVKDHKERVDSVGVGVPCWIDREGSFIRCPHRLELEGANFSENLANATGVKVAVFNDADCAAASEFEAARLGEESSVLVVNFGTGIGAGLLLDYKVFRGGHGYFGELGHMRGYGDEPCPCGAMGCFESQLRAISRRKSRGSIDEYLDLAALGIFNLSKVLDPQVVVIGGGVPDYIEGFVWEISRRVSAMGSVAPRWRPPRFRGATHGKFAGAVGAVVLVGGMVELM